MILFSFSFFPTNWVLLLHLFRWLLLFGSNSECWWVPTLSFRPFLFSIYTFFPGALVGSHAFPFQLYGENIYIYISNPDSPPSSILIHPPSHLTSPTRYLIRILTITYPKSFSPITCFPFSSPIPIRKNQYSHRSSRERPKMSPFPHKFCQLFLQNESIQFLALPTFPLYEPPWSLTDYHTGLLTGLLASTIAPSVQSMFYVAERQNAFVKA